MYSGTRTEHTVSITNERMNKRNGKKNSSPTEPTKSSDEPEMRYYFQFLIFYYPSAFLCSKEVLQWMSALAYVCCICRMYKEYYPYFHSISLSCTHAHVFLFVSFFSAKFRGKGKDRVARII